MWQGKKFSEPCQSLRYWTNASVALSLKHMDTHSVFPHSAWLIQDFLFVEGLSQVEADLCVLQKRCLFMIFLSYSLCLSVTKSLEKNKKGNFPERYRCKNPVWQEKGTELGINFLTRNNTNWHKTFTVHTSLVAYESSWWKESQSVQCSPYMSRASVLTLEEKRRKRWKEVFLFETW